MSTGPFHGTDANRRRYERLSPAQREAIELLRAGHARPAARAEEIRVRDEVEAEFPPRHPLGDAGPFLRELLAECRAIREQKGLTFSALQHRTGIDADTLSRLEQGELSDPSLATLTRYAEALGKRLAWSLVDPV